jgi:hypothetical protein
MSAVFGGGKMKIRYIGERERVYIPAAGSIEISRGGVIDLPGRLAAGLIMSGQFKEIIESETLGFQVNNKKPAKINFTKGDL